MSGDRTHPSETVTRKPDDDVGKRGTASVGGGKQTADQAAITGAGPSGLDERERRDPEREAAISADRPPAAVGGASQGHAEQKATPDRYGESSAKGHYKVEKDRG